MNHIFKTIFNQSTGTFVAVPEIAKGRVKTSGQVVTSRQENSQRIVSSWVKLSALATALLLITGQIAFALPTTMVVPNNPYGASVTSSNPTANELDVRANGPTDGSSIITASGANNANYPAVAGNVVTLNWAGNGFQVANGETVKFINVNANTALQAWINVDKSGQKSLIAGTIGGYNQDASGNLTPSGTPIVLINPNGIIINGTASVQSNFSAFAGDYDTSTKSNIGAGDMGILTLNGGPITVNPGYTITQVAPSIGQSGLLSVQIAAPDLNGVSNNSLPFIAGRGGNHVAPPSILGIYPSNGIGLNFYGQGNSPRGGYVANVTGINDAPIVNFVAPKSEQNLDIVVPFMLDTQGGGTINFDLSNLTDMGAYTFDANQTQRNISIRVDGNFDGAYAKTTPPGGWEITNINMPSSLNLENFSTRTNGSQNIFGGDVVASDGQDFLSYGGTFSANGSSISSLGQATGTKSNNGVRIIGGQGMNISNSAIKSDSGILIEGDGNYGWNDGMPSQFMQNDTGLTIANTKIIDEQPSSSNLLGGVVELGSYYADSGINIDANSSINSTGACENCTIIIGSSYNFSSGANVGLVNIGSPITTNGANVKIDGNQVNLASTAAINLTDSNTVATSSGNGAEFSVYAYGDNSIDAYGNGYRGLFSNTNATIIDNAPINVSGPYAWASFNPYNSYKQNSSGSVAINAPVTVSGDQSSLYAYAGNGNLDINAPLSLSTTNNSQNSGGAMYFGTGAFTSRGSPTPATWSLNINSPVTVKGARTCIETGGDTNINANITMMDNGSVQDGGFVANSNGSFNLTAGSEISSSGGISAVAGGHNGLAGVVDIFGSIINTFGANDLGNYTGVSIGSGTPVTIEKGGVVSNINNSILSDQAGIAGVRISSANIITVNGNVSTGGVSSSGGILINGSNIAVGPSDPSGNGSIVDSGIRDVGNGITLSSDGSGNIDVAGYVNSDNNSVSISNYMPSMGSSFPAVYGPITIEAGAHVRGMGGANTAGDGQIWLNNSATTLSASNKETSNNGVLYSGLVTGTFNSDNTTTSGSTSGMAGSVNLNGNATVNGWLDAGKNGPSITDLFIDPVMGSSVYGANPGLSFALIDASGNPYKFTDGTSITGSASYLGAPNAQSSVGSYSYTYDGGLSLSGSNSGNYKLASGMQSAGWSITPATLSVTNTANNKVYDGATSAVVTGVLSGVVNGDNVSAVSSGSFVSKNVGNGIAVDSSTSITGVGSSNYILSNPSNVVMADITPKPINESAVANNKVYDGNTTAVVSSITSNDIIAGDSVSFNYANANFNTPDVGTAKPVLVDGITAIGADAGNYTVTSTVTTAADITPKPIPPVIPPTPPVEPPVTPPVEPPVTPPVEPPVTPPVVPPVTPPVVPPVTPPVDPVEPPVTPPVTPTVELTKAPAIASPTANATPINVVITLKPSDKQANGQAITMTGNSVYIATGNKEAPPALTVKTGPRSDDQSSTGQPEEKKKLQ